MLGKKVSKQKKKRSCATFTLYLCGFARLYRIHTNTVKLKDQINDLKQTRREVVFNGILCILRHKILVRIFEWGDSYRKPRWPVLENCILRKSCCVDLCCENVEWSEKNGEWTEEN